MTNPSKWAAIATTIFVIGGCSSNGSGIAVDPGVARKIDVLNDCFPGLYEKLDALLDIAKLWNQKDPNPPNPTGLTATKNGNQIDVTLVLPGTTCTFNMAITFFSQTGVQDSPAFNQNSLSQMLDDAATDMRNRSLTPGGFVLGVWTASGTTATNATLTGSGAFTGKLGGSANENELERLRTTTATPAGGEPPTADGTVTIAGATTCVLKFNTDPLNTDTVVNQQFPIGTVTLEVTGSEAVTASMVFNNTNIAKITVSGVSGFFELNLTTFALTHKLA